MVDVEYLLEDLVDMGDGDGQCKRLDNVDDLTLGEEVGPERRWSVAVCGEAACCELREENEREGGGDRSK